MDKSAKQSESDAKTNLPDAYAKCEICEKWAKYFCHACDYALCDSCLVCHCKFTQCTMEQAEQITTDFEEFAKDVKVVQKNLSEEMDRVRSKSEEVKNINAEIAENCIKLIQKDQDNAIEYLNKWYQEQKDEVKAFATRNNVYVEKVVEDLFQGIMEKKREINQTIQDNLATQEAQDDLKRQLTEEMSRLQNIEFNSVQCFYLSCVDYVKAIGQSKALSLIESSMEIQNSKDSVEQTPALKPMEQTSASSIEMFQLIRRNGLRATLLDGFRDGCFQQVQVIGGMIGVLYSNRIDVYASSGDSCNYVETMTNRAFSCARDMYIHPKGDIIIADFQSGLLRCSQNFFRVTCLAGGKFVAIIPTESNAFWAVEIEETECDLGDKRTVCNTILHACNFHDDWSVDEKKIRLTDQCLAKGSALGSKLYFNSKNRILELDTESHKMVLHGMDATEGKTLGELSSNFRVVSDCTSGLLLILDPDLNRIQLFDPDMNCWYPVSCTIASEGTDVSLCLDTAKNVFRYHNSLYIAGYKTNETCSVPSLAFYKCMPF